MARRHYYHPEMQGSWSLKAVLPAIAPELGYDQMEVGDGKQAQYAYSAIVAPDTEDDRRRELTQGLREYCELDTMAMVRLAWLFEGRRAARGSKYAAQ